MSTTDITRDMVITAASGLRELEPTDATTAALDAALRSIVTLAVDIGVDEEIERVTAYAAIAGDDADGLLLDAWIRSGGPARSCTITAFAVTDAALTLTGSTALMGSPIDSDAAPTTLRTTPLSGPVLATTPIDTASYGVLSVVATGAAAGTSAGTGPGTTTESVPDPRTPAEKAAAKETYERRIAAAKKAYAKALRKAGRNKRKKKAAQRALATRKSAAKAQYAAALVDHHTVTVPTTGTDSRPFALTISTDFTS